ncbi:MAG: SAM-dependent methyltransferase [Prevotella sp.]|nr:SAM-dependent methyltransferase [Prevotella sp.]
MNEQTKEYVRIHASDDVRRLALQGAKDPAVDMTMALQQIAGRQTARQKLPSWAAADDIVYPPHLNMEQCSSELTARYKATIVKEQAEDKCGNGKPARGGLVDLTGGLGVDFYWMSQGYDERHYVEQNETLCSLAEHNFGVLGHRCSVHCCTAADYLSAMEHADTVFIDPARRDEHGGRTYGIADCTPNILELLPTLMQKACRVVLKLSPMLDWRKAIADLAHVSEVHIVSVDNECKELLLVLGAQQTKGSAQGSEDGATGGIPVVCVNIQSKGTQLFTFYHPTASKAATATSHPAIDSQACLCEPNASTQTYLYEPNASIMKAGCFAAIEERYGARQIAENSHLFLAADDIGDFPGRQFLVQAVSSMNKQELRHALCELRGGESTPIKRANIAVRNFPLSTDQLRRKLHLADGGDTYLFATTLADGSHRLFICRKKS